MSRKIVIVPSFASSHFLKCWIPNMLEVIEPDIIIVNEGLFPNGPENKGHVDSDEFKRKYYYPNTTPTNMVGFDWDETVHTYYELVNPGIYSKSRLMGIEYNHADANKCFLECITYFGFDPTPGDLIFPLEPDAFVYEGDKEIINEEISKLKPGEGLQCKWVDFLETQYYTEAINLEQPKYRRFCYCFDSMKNYKRAMDGFMSQSYPRLKKTESFFIRHYPWFVYDKWKELRYDLIHRNDPQYWKDFENGLQEIRNKSKYFNNLIKGIPVGETIQYYMAFRDDSVLIRSSRQDEGKWAKFIDIKHPKHIKEHPNFIK